MSRWVERARAGDGLDRKARNHFEVTDALRERLAFWRGNVVAVHRELVEAAQAGGSAPALRFEAFVAELLAWVRWWNTEHPMPVLAGRTPLQAWLAGRPEPADRGAHG